ncbi:unnamed protein product [Trichogramma brassicae]|uniref:Uncharacterized protein n=1 Tax=Trichogramma brassicae TaxID=86971 RepID=A0A6H5I151_9HYME|nr:unnamed protein product [Trichogramma brassicae]
MIETSQTFTLKKLYTIKKNQYKVTEELNNTRPEAGNDFNFNPVDSVENENFEKRLLPELSAKHAHEAMELQEMTNEYIIIDYEYEDIIPESPACKEIETETNESEEINLHGQNADEKMTFDDVKLELPSISTTICKSDYQTCRTIVKIDNENQTDNINESISIDFEIKDVKLELPSTSKNICKSNVSSTCLQLCFDSKQLCLHFIKPFRSCTMVPRRFMLKQTRCKLKISITMNKFRYTHNTPTPERPKSLHTSNTCPLAPSPPFPSASNCPVLFNVAARGPAYPPRKTHPHPQ